MLRLLRWTFDLILTNPLIFWACVVANLVGAIWGAAIWYGPMLAASPLWAWPFIPDCPLAALLGSIALLGLRAGRRWGWFYALTAFACVQYGIWTLFFWLRHWSLAGVVAPFEAVLFVTHIGLLCEGVLLATRIGPVSLPARLAVLGWFALSLFVDYGLGFHPPLTPFVPERLIFWVTAALTATLGTALLLLPRAAPAPPAMPASALPRRG